MSRHVEPARAVYSESVVISHQHLESAARIIIDQLGPKGIELVGGQKWWQWRGPMNDLHGEWIEMKSDRNERIRQGRQRCNRVMLYVHGGAFFFGSVDTHRYMLERHAKRLKGQVFAPQYRLAPQFPFPCALQDCFAAYLYLLTIHRPSEILLAGDSAGAGMVLSMLCTIRDRNLPLPAGAILISAWVDLTHSFPSVIKNRATDYVPPMGFGSKPSIAWPVLEDHEVCAIRQKAKQKRASNNQQNGMIQEEDPHARSNADTLRVVIDGETVEIKRQIHLYTTNRLITHPLVSPIAQPSLGGLPPLYFLCGGAEMLRDEQVYIAHKASTSGAHVYAPSDAILDEHDPNREIINKYEPTYVQLQVWDGLCHAAPTFTCIRAAKHMYNAISQFGAWALSRAQNAGIDILSDPDFNGPTSSSAIAAENTFSRNKKKTERPSVGKAGDILPPFHKHLIRQRVDEDGHIFPLERSTILLLLRRPRSEVCAINPDLAKQWLIAQKEYDLKFAKAKRRVRRQMESYPECERLESGESPPPVALVARRPIPGTLPQRQVHRNCGILMWSRWPFGRRGDPDNEAGTDLLVDGSKRSSESDENTSNRGD